MPVREEDFPHKSHAPAPTWEVVLVPRQTLCCGGEGPTGVIGEPERAEDRLGGALLGRSRGVPRRWGGVRLGRLRLLPHAGSKPHSLQSLSMAESIPSKQPAGEPPQADRHRLGADHHVLVRAVQQPSAVRSRASAKARLHSESP